MAELGIELGVVTAREQEMLSFYCEVLDLDLESSAPLGDGGMMHRLAYGSNIVKLICPTSPSKAGVESTARSAPVDSPADIMDLCGLLRGFRMLTMIVHDLNEVLRRCDDRHVIRVCSAMDDVRVSPSGARQVVRWSVVEDPDGNWVEFVELVHD